MHSVHFCYTILFVEYVSPISPDDLLRILNGRSTFGEERRRHTLSPLAHLKPAPDAIYKVANKELQLELCSWVDDWLNTALDRVTGEEIPTNREWTRAREAHRAFLAYEDEHRPRMRLQKDDDHELPEEACVLFARPPALQWSGTDEPIEAAQQEAVRILAALIASNWKYTIAKCRYARCSKYFQLQHSKRPYKNGTFCCRKHSQLATGARLTAQSRRDRKRELIEVAAQKLNEWRLKKESFWKNNPVEQWLASQVSLYIGEHKKLNFFRHEVKTNWVTRNWARIQAQAQGGIHATR